MLCQGVEMNDKVSVIIPCFNGEQYIDNSIYSVYMQDYDSVELIVVDDGSTDRSREIINSWIPKFERKGFTLQYVYQDNRGSGGATDTGLKHVTGVYLTLLDADDIYLQGAISKKVQVLADNPDITIVRSNGWIVSEEKRWLFVFDKVEKEKKDIFEDLLYGRTNNWAGSYMVRTKDLFEFYKGRTIYPSRGGQNLQILLPMAYKKKAAFIDEPLMEYIKRDNSLSSNMVDGHAHLAKSLENAKVYKTIRQTVLYQIADDKEEREYFSLVIEKGYWNLLFMIALGKGEKELLRESYQKMKALGDIDIQKTIDYYKVVFPPVAFCLRGLRKAHVLKDH